MREGVGSRRDAEHAGASDHVSVTVTRISPRRHAEYSFDGHQQLVSRRALLTVNSDQCDVSLGFFAP